MNLKFLRLKPKNYSRKNNVETKLGLGQQLTTIPLPAVRHVTCFFFFFFSLINYSFTCYSFAKGHGNQRVEASISNTV